MFKFKSVAIWNVRVKLSWSLLLFGGALGIASLFGIYTAALHIASLALVSFGAGMRTEQFFISRY